MNKKTVVSFSLDVEADKTILLWLEHQENKSAAIRGALQAHIIGRAVTLADIYRDVQEIRRKLDAGVVTVSGAGAADDAGYDEPPDIAAALDSLGL
jgi:hypothetical protein